MSKGCPHYNDRWGGEHACSHNNEIKSCYGIESPSCPISLWDDMDQNEKMTRIMKYLETILRRLNR